MNVAWSPGAELDWAKGWTSISAHSLCTSYTTSQSRPLAHLASWSEQNRRWVPHMLSHPKVREHRGQRRLRSKACPGTQDLGTKGHVPWRNTEWACRVEAAEKYRFAARRWLPWPLVALQSQHAGCPFSCSFAGVGNHCPENKMCLRI